MTTYTALYLFCLLFPFIIIFRRDFFNYLKSLNSREKGSLLRKEMKDLILQGRFKDRGFIFPEYKFFTPLIQKLIYLSRKFGTPIQSILKELDKEISKDMRFEKTFMKSFIGGFIQIGFMFTIIWGFVYLSKSMADIKISNQTLTIMICLQTIGLALYLVLFPLLKKKYFDHFNHYFESLYILKVLSSIGLDPSRCLVESKIKEVFEKGKFKDENKQLILALDNWRKWGKGIQGELEDLLEQVWFKREEELTLFSDKVGALKFLVLAVFFLSSYFVYLMGLTQNLADF